LRALIRKKVPDTFSCLLFGSLRNHLRALIRKKVPDTFSCLVPLFLPPQVRKPLLGTGEARPIGFSHPPSPGLLLVVTDGFSNYVKRERLLRELLWIDFAVLPRKLVEMVRLPSGDLWDDIGIVACKPRRATKSQTRHEITDTD